MGQPLWAQQLNIFFKTSPTIDLIRPHGGPVGLSVLVTDAGGKPVEDGWADIRLDAPKPGGFFSTDFPLIEGTRLTEMRLPLRRGQAEWKYDWPIRGEYRLAVEATTADGKKASKVFPITVRENSRKWLALGGFSLGLFLLGFIAGRVFTRPSNARLSLLLGVIFAAPSPPTAIARLSQPASLAVEPATVGKLSRITWRLDGGPPANGSTLTLAIQLLEEGHTVFALEKLPVAGEFSLSFHFVDGSEHRVTAIAEMAGHAPVRTEQIISVAAVEPPSTAALPAIAFFMALIALGLG
ncbi:MAG: hypothetical protein ACREOR_07250, partial [Candidatus Binatia bacterium]